MLSGLVRRHPTLVWAPVRLLPLIVTTAYLAVLRGPLPVCGWDWVCGLVSAALTVVGGRWPLTVLLGQLGLVAACVWLVTAPLGQSVAFVLGAFALGELVMRADRTRIVVGLVVYVAVQVVMNTRHFDPALAVSAILLSTATPVLAGTYVRSVLRVAVRAQGQREAAVREARAAERTAIARELHDLVAHHVSSIAVRVGAARHALGPRAPEVAEALDQVHATARVALTDLRRLVATLRDPDRLTEHPGVAVAEPDALPAAVAGAVQRVRAAGLRVDAEIDPSVAGLDSMRRLAVLRVVQEGLTNVLKHAGPQARATLVLRRTDERIMVRVCDDGAERVGARAEPGFGLIGMRERIELLGGSVRAGAGESGWELVVTIPA